MKNKTFLLSFIIVVALISAGGLLGAYLFVDQIKGTIKSVSVRIYEQVYAWSSAKKASVSVLEEKLLIDEALVAYTNKLVFKKPESIELHLIGNQDVSVTIFQINRLGLKTIHSVDTYKLREFPKPVYSTFDGIISPSHNLKIETEGLNPGWIGIYVSDENGNEVEIPAFLDANARPQGILFVESTDTLLAYNPAYKRFFIPNFYAKNLDKAGSGIIPRNTPITYVQSDLSNAEDIYCHDHLINSDAVLKRTLTKLGIEFTSVSDKELDDAGIYQDVDVLIFGTHNEYWTTEKAVNVMNFIDGGGRVLLLGGNTAWRKVFREQNRTWLHGHGLINDPIFNRLITDYLGTYYDAADARTYAPIKLVNHQFLSDRFDINVGGSEILGDGTTFEHCETEISGVSGHETDKLVAEANGFTLIAKGLNEKGGADVVHKAFNSGGEVLNFSSLATWHNKDQHLVRLIEGFLAKTQKKK